MPQAYRTDLAFIHDVGFDFFARGAAPFLLHTLKRAGITEGRIIDLGCGSGIWARELVDAGYDVLGIDISPDMIEIARERVPEGEFRVGSLLKADLPACAAVTSLGECFNYLFDPDNSKKSLRHVFHRVYDALNPGGLFIFDVAEPGRSAGVTMKHAAGDDWAVMVEFDENKKKRRLRRSITTFRKVGELYRRDEEIHDLQLYHSTELVQELRRAGFRVRVLRGYGNMRFPKSYVGFLARKSASSAKKGQLNAGPVAHR